MAELVLANRILAAEGVLDAFGHVSVRQPQRPGHFLLACSRAPELVTADDILEFGADSEPVAATSAALYSERYIHGEIYRLRPDVGAICHHHAPAIMPFCISGVAIVPVMQHGALLGPTVPFWDSREEFGDTNMLVTNAGQGASLARALGPHFMVLMRRHGASVVGAEVKEMVFRAISACRNAAYQHAAAMLGSIDSLSPGEIDRARNVPASAIERAWDYWRARLSR